MQTTVVGTGIMGAGLARSLAREGHQVAVWNRTPERARELAHDQITAHADLASAVAGAEVVLTMLFDADSVLDVTPELVGSLGPDAVWAQASTVGPAGMSRIAEAAGEAAGRLLDTPVLGTRKPAEDGTLVVLVSGTDPARTTAQPVFDAIGGRTMVVGDQLGQASALKLAVNSWVASLNVATAQALGLTEALGLDPQLFLDAIKGGGSDSGYAHLKGALMTDRTWDDPSFAVDSVRKDVALMLAAAEETSFPDDLLATLLALYDRTSERGAGDADMAAVRLAFDR